MESYIFGIKHINKELSLNKKVLSSQDFSDNKGYMRKERETASSSIIRKLVVHAGNQLVHYTGKNSMTLNKQLG